MKRDNAAALNDQLQIIEGSVFRMQQIAEDLEKVVQKIVALVKLDNEDEKAGDHPGVKP